MIEDLFTYHAPKPGQQERYQAIREAAKTLAKVIVASTSQHSPDQEAAIRHLRECVMTANACIALESDDAAEWMRTKVA
jgi:hypothetical protein